MIYYIWLAVFLKRAIMCFIKSIERLRPVCALVSMMANGIPVKNLQIFSPKEKLLERLFDNLKYIAGKK